MIVVKGFIDGNSDTEIIVDSKVGDGCVVLFGFVVTYARQLMNCLKRDAIIDRK